MHSDEKRTIEELACTFRRAIESCLPDLGAAFRYFPRGSCGEATVLLGTYLIENGIVPFYYANGVRRQQGTSALWVSHAWLYRDGLIVDITADQFPEVVSKVIVTTDSPWHRTFDVTIEHIADCRIYDERATTRLERMYRKIVSKIETA